MKGRHNWVCMSLFELVIPVQAERIMEALELYREETRKMEEHKYACENAGKQVQAYHMQ